MLFKLKGWHSILAIRFFSLNAASKSFCSTASSVPSLGMNSLSLLALYSPLSSFPFNISSLYELNNRSAILHGPVHNAHRFDLKGVRHFGKRDPFKRDYTSFF